MLHIEHNMGGRTLHVGLAYIMDFDQLSTARVWLFLFHWRLAKRWWCLTTDVRKYTFAPSFHLFCIFNKWEPLLS